MLKIDSYRARRSVILGPLLFLATASGLAGFGIAMESINNAGARDQHQAQGNLRCFTPAMLISSSDAQKRVEIAGGQGYLFEVDASKASIYPSVPGSAVVSQLQLRRTYDLREGEGNIDTTVTLTAGDIKESIEVEFNRDVQTGDISIKCGEPD